MRIYIFQKETEFQSRIAGYVLLLIGCVRGQIGLEAHAVRVGRRVVGGARVRRAGRLLAVRGRPDARLRGRADRRVQTRVGAARVAIGR